MNIELRNTAKYDFGKVFSKLMKKEGTIWYQNQIIIQQIFYLKNF